MRPLPELLSFVEGRPEPHILFDTQHRILAANAASRRQFSPDLSVVGRTCCEVSHPGSRTPNAERHTVGLNRIGANASTRRRARCLDISGSGRLESDDPKPHRQSGRAGGAPGHQRTLAVAQAQRAQARLKLAANAFRRPEFRPARPVCTLEAKALASQPPELPHQCCDPSIFVAADCLDWVFYLEPWQVTAEAQGLLKG